MPRAKTSTVEETAATPADQPQVSKSQAVRNYLNEHRDALPKAVSEALKAQGVDITPNYVSNIKSTMGKKKRRPKTAATTTAPSAQPAKTDQISFAQLLEAKKLVEKLGSTDAAKRALAAFAELST